MSRVLHCLPAEAAVMLEHACPLFDFINPDIINFSVDAVDFADPISFNHFRLGSVMFLESFDNPDLLWLAGERYQSLYTLMRELMLLDCLTQ